MDAILQTLFETTITMSVITGVFILLLPMLEKKFRPGGIYYSLAILLLGFLIPFRPTLPESALTLTLPPLLQTSVSREPLEQSRMPQQPLIPDTPSGSVFLISASQIIFMVWIFGALFVLGWHVLQHIKFMKIVRRWSRDIPDPFFNKILNKEKQTLRIQKNIALKLCPPIDTPLLTGFFRPMLLLPDLDFNETECGLVIRHELIHCRRRDIWGKALMIAVLAVHWFNPLIYLMAKTYVFYGEASCDAWVIRDSDLDTRQCYSETIISVIRRQSALRTAFSTSFYGGKNGLKRRILSIMDRKRKGFGMAVIFCVLLVTLGTGMAFAFNSEEYPEETVKADITGKSDDYRLIAEMMELDRSMSIAEYNLRLNEICTNNGKRLFSLIADVHDEIPPEDPLYFYYASTLTYSSSEEFADNMGGEEVSWASGYAERAEYEEAPIRQEHDTDAEWALIYEQHEMGYDFFVGAGYIMVYDIPDKTAISPAERDSRLSGFKTDMQAFMDGLNESELFASDLEKKISGHIEQLSERHSDGLMIISGELSHMDYIGEVFSEKSGL